jgi:hypothetical protein
MPGYRRLEGDFALQEKVELGWREEVNAAGNGGNESERIREMGDHGKGSGTSDHERRSSLRTFFAAASVITCVNAENDGSQASTTDSIPSENSHPISMICENLRLKY